MRVSSLFRTQLRGRRPRTRRHWCRLTCERLEERVVLDVSAPPILQYFEGSWQTIEQRTPDIFNAGYGQVYLPPPSRADSGNQSVGYDVYDRFDLGSPGDPTLYGTEDGLKATVSALHQAGVNVYLDLVWNHDGFSNLGTTGFAAAGGYPGFALTLTPSNNYAGYNDIDGDFHSAFDTSTTGMRLSGLIDIAQEKNYQFIRSPVDPNNPLNLPAGTTPAYGRLANVADPNNARFYPDQSLQPISVYDPTTGEQNIKIYPFNNANPLDGTPVAENALGYLMRYTQWLVQYIGVDGFRVDAAKNMPPWVLNYLDRATYRSSFRTLLNGSQEQVFSFSEVFDSDKSLLQQYVNKDINPANPGTIGGNRDVLDFPLYFALDSNLTGNGLQNDWNNVINASVDTQDDGLGNNGSEGVSFVSNQDVTAPYLSNVAYAYTLMRPGNTIVYYNAQEFGTNRSFPNQGRGDALGGLYGNAITTLVNIRDTHPDGNFIVRDLEQNDLVYERQDSAIVALSNRLDSGYDSRTVQTSFAPGTPLIELTGNAANPTVDPDGAIPQLLVVNADGTVNLRVPRNTNDARVETDDGYVIYAPSGPQGQLNLTNVDHVIPGQTPTAATNGTAVLSSIPVITAPSFQIQLNTTQVNLLGFYRDQDADGDNAVFKIDDGVDVTGQGFVSTNPGDVTYGFQQFTTVHSPGYFNANGNGQYVQTVNVSNLSNGLHYLTVRAFRHRNPGEPPIFTDFREAFYVDNTPALATLVSFNPLVTGVNENRQVFVSTDPRINNVHIFLDLPAALTNAQVLSMVGNANQANQLDRDSWTEDFSNLTSGNHVVTVVSYQMDGSAAVQRFPGLYTSTIFGLGLGDVNFDGQINAIDVQQFGPVLNSNNTQFNPAADLNGDGLINNDDLLEFYQRLQAVGAIPSTLAAYSQLLGPTQNNYAIYQGNGVTLAVNQPSGTLPPLTIQWDLNNDGVFTDATGSSVTLSAAQLAAFGINAVKAYPISVEVSDGNQTDIFPLTLTVQDVPPTVASVTPANSATSVLPSSVLTVTFSKAVNVTSTPFSLQAPPGVFVPFSFSPAPPGGTTTFTLTPLANLPAGTLVKLTIVASQVTDLIGTNLAANVIASFTTDSAPTVAGISPTNGASNIPLTSALTVTFNEAVNVTASAFTLQAPGGMPVAFSLSPAVPGGTTTYTLTPFANLPAGTQVTLTVVAGQVADLIGTHLAANVVDSFTTDAAPTVTGFTPANGASNIAPPSTLTVTFNKAVTVTASAFILQAPTAVAFSLSPTPPGGATTYTLTPTVPLPEGAAVTLTVVASQVADLVGTNLPANVSDNFTLGQAPAFTSGTPTGEVTVGQPYQFTFTASGSPGPTLSASNLPSWLTFTPTTGVLTGSTSAQGVYSNITITASNGINPPAIQTFSITVAVVSATVQSVQVNDGSVQRSMVTSLLVTLSAGTLGTFTLLENGHATSGVALTPTLVSTGTSTQTEKITFSGSEIIGGSLADGQYQLLYNGNAVPVTHFFRLFGDVNGDGRVDNTDLAMFMAAYRSRKGMPNYQAYFDFDANGLIDATDLYQIDRRYGMKLNADGSYSPI